MFLQYVITAVELSRKKSPNKLPLFSLTYILLTANTSSILLPEICLEHRLEQAVPWTERLWCDFTLQMPS